MAIKLSQLGGGGEFVPEFFSGRLGHELTDVNPLIISPPAGKRILLSSLSVSTNADLENTTVEVGQNIVIDGLTLIRDGGGANSFNIAPANTVSAGIATISANSASSYRFPFIGGIDEEVTVSTTDIDGRSVSYSYAWGE